MKMIDRERINGLLKEQGWTQATLARSIGVTPSAIQQVLSGKTKNSRLIPQIAHVLSASEEYIIGTSSERYKPVSGTISPTELADALHGKLFGYDKSLSKQLIDEPLFDRMLHNRVYDPYWIISQIARASPEVFTGKDSDYMPKIATVVMNTDAMSPTINNGDLLLISKESSVVHGAQGIWAISYGGLPMVRRLMPLPREQGYLVSADNRSAPSFEAPTSDVELNGLVFSLMRMMS